jgi:hypothetical protein
MVEGWGERVINRLITLVALLTVVESMFDGRAAAPASDMWRTTENRYFATG